MTSKALNHLRSTKGHAYRQAGFTLIEALVAGSVFVIVMGMVGGILFNAFSTDRKATVSKNLYEETRIALERVAKEVRKGTIDYEEYWSWYRQPGGSTGYGKNYGYYGLQFYRLADFPTQTPSTPGTRSRSDDNTGLSAGLSAIGNAKDSGYGRCAASLIPSVPTGTDPNNFEQCELYIISADGKEKTIFRVSKDMTVTPNEYRLTMLKLTGYDYGADHVAARDAADATDGDGQIDTFVSEGDYAGDKFLSIQPDTINIKRLSFFVAPLDDPRKAFANFSNDVQIQPHVTIVISAEPSKKQQSALRGSIPQVTLQTTITGRAQNEVKSLK